MTSWEFWRTLTIGGVIMFFLIVLLCGLFIFIQSRLRNGKWPRCNKLHHGRVDKGR
jgi:hypothetical protein